MKSLYVRKCKVIIGLDYRLVHDKPKVIYQDNRSLIS